MIRYGDEHSAVGFRRRRNGLPARASFSALRAKESLKELVWDVNEIEAWEDR